MRRLHRPRTAVKRGEQKENERVDDMVIDYRVILGRQRREEYEEHENAPEHSRETEPDTGEEREPDAKKPCHEYPIDCGNPRKALEQFGERTARPMEQKAARGRAAAYPCVRAGSGEPEPEELIEERPKEREREHEPREDEDVSFHKK